MDPLKRNNPGVRATNHEDRIQVLERRITPPPPEWAVAQFSLTPQTVTDAGTLLTWEHFRTTNSLVFGTSPTVGGAKTDTAGDIAIRLAVEGIVMATTWVRFETGAFYRKVSINAGGGELDPISNRADVQASTASADDSDDSDGNPLAVNDVQWYASSDDQFPAWFSTQANVGSGDPSMDAISASMTVVWWPSTGVAWDLTAIY